MKVIHRCLDYVMIHTVCDMLHSMTIVCLTFFFQEHSCVLHCIIGWDCILGAWSRVEGYPCDPNPNDPLANVSSESLFNEEGRLNPSITILGECFLYTWQTLV